MFIASIITCLLSVLGIGIVLARVTPREERWLITCCVLGTAPMCWIMFHCVRLPLEGWLKTALGEGELLRWIRTAYAPLTEEPAKLWPLALPFIRRAVTSRSIARYALALGTGFALGEVFTVAGLVAAKQPAIAALPWYQLTPFVSERLQTFIIHSGMTAVALAVWRRGSGFLPGLLLAIFVHWLVNFPITMGQRGWLGPSPAVSQMIVVMWVATCFVAALAWLLLLDVGQVGLGVLLHGRAICPTCGVEYDRRLIGLNFGDTRYELCPHCGQWHWTKSIRLAK